MDVKVSNHRGEEVAPGKVKDGKGQIRDFGELLKTLLPGETILKADGKILLVQNVLWLPDGHCIMNHAEKVN